MITLDEYLLGRDKKFPDEFTDEILKNAKSTIAKASELLSAFGEKRKVTSGWRPLSINKLVNGALKSQHIWANAIDIHDPDGKLAEWCKTNVKRLEEVGIWMESPQVTIGWVHWQTKPPRSGNRFFIP